MEKNFTDRPICKKALSNNRYIELQIVHNVWLKHDSNISRNIKVKFALAMFNSIYHHHHYHHLGYLRTQAPLKSFDIFALYKFDYYYYYYYY